MTADVVTTYSHTAWCDDCSWMSIPCRTIEAATKLAQEHNLLRHDGEAA